MAWVSFRKSHVNIHYVSKNLSARTPLLQESITHKFLSGQPAPLKTTTTTQNRRVELFSELERAKPETV